MKANVLGTLQISRGSFGHSCFPLPAGAAWTLRQAQKNMHARALCKEQLRQAMTSEHFAAHLAETVSDGEQVAGYGVGRMS